MGMAQLFSAQVIVSSGLTFSLPQLQDALSSPALAAEASQGSSDPFSPHQAVISLTMSLVGDSQISQTLPGVRGSHPVCEYLT